jgi:hypothetical protein
MIDLHWASTGASCQWSDWVDLYFQWAKQAVYLIPSNWSMHICSAVKSAGYRAEANPPSIGEVKGGVLHAFVIPKVIYSDEQATLHAELLGETISGAHSNGLRESLQCAARPFPCRAA